MRKIVIFGSGGHAKVVIDAIEKAQEYSIYGLIDGTKEPGSTVLGYRVIGKEQILDDLRDVISGGIVAIGDNWTRQKVVTSIRTRIPDFQFVTVVHPAASLARGVEVGAGTVVMAGAIINTDTTIGEHCIINTKASVDHDSTIGNFVTVAPGATVGGNVKVGDFSAISLGVSIIHSITIGEHTVVGAGAMVVKDIDSYVVAYGNPAQVRRNRKPGEQYL